MPKIRIPEMEVDTEDFGFPSSVTPTAEEVVARITKLQEQKNFWEGKAKEAQAFSARSKENEKRVREMECDLLLEGAVRDFKISKHQVQFYREMYLAGNAMKVKEHIEKLTAQEYLKQEMGARGDEGPSNPEDEIRALAAQKMANNKDLSESEARKQVLSESPSLYERQRQAEYAKTARGAKGGTD